MNDEWIELETRTRRLVVVDSEGYERIVGEVVNGHAELRLDLPGTAEGHRSSVLLFTRVRDRDIGPGLGVEVWLNGDSVLALGAWLNEEGDWMTEVELADE
jgi:hypothetical protein